MPEDGGRQGLCGVGVSCPGYQGVLNQKLSLSAVYGSECVQPSQCGDGEDEVPPVIAPPLSGNYPVGTELDVNGPWYDLPPTNEQTRRTERYRRTANGGCTWARCVNGDWDRYEMRGERRMRPGGLGGGDDTSGK